MMNTSRSAPSRPVILSKTTTPLQQLQQKLKMEDWVLQQKRRNPCTESLVAMRLPLAPTARMFTERLWKQKMKAKKKKTTAEFGHFLATSSLLVLCFCVLPTFAGSYFKHKWHVARCLNPTLPLLLVQWTPTHHLKTKPFHQSPQHTVCLRCVPRFGRADLWRAGADS